MSNPSLGEVMIQVLRTFDPEQSNGYGGAAYHQWEHSRIIIENNIVDIRDANSNRPPFWKPMFDTPNIKNALMAALNKAYRRFTQDLTEAIDIAKNELEDEICSISICTHWMDFVPKYKKYKVENIDYGVPSRVYGKRGNNCAVLKLPTYPDEEKLAALFMG